MTGISLEGLIQHEIEYRSDLARICIVGLIVLCNLKTLDILCNYLTSHGVYAACDSVYPQSPAAFVCLVLQDAVADPSPLWVGFVGRALHHTACRYGLERRQAHGSGCAMPLTSERRTALYAMWLSHRHLCHQERGAEAYGNVA